MRVLLKNPDEERSSPAKTWVLAGRSARISSIPIRKIPNSEPPCESGLGGLLNHYSVKKAA